ncbi:LOW QUALITY PROTEIN: hypothetical protein V1477_006438 [Vespula maculifrons]|uniref:Uncharacterized protein n=1 Tax=Vespula maculifrons TaxID=7453 RepID=A0ABD2CKD8_VESMC
MGRARRVLSNDQGPVLLGAIVSEKKIVKEKSRLLSVRSRQKKCGRRGRDESFPMTPARFSYKCFFPLFPLNRYNSAPIGSICTQKYVRRGRDEPFPMIKRTRRALSNDPRSALLGAIFSEKKIVKEKCFFPLFPLNRYNSAPIGSICTQKDGRRMRVEPFQTAPVRFS